jgi:hypothetical protein
MKATATLKAYLSPYSRIAPGQLATEGAVSQMIFSDGTGEYLQREGYTHIGTAVIEVDVFDQKEIVANKVDALREEIKATRAKATARCTEIEGQIQSLLAIEFTPAAAE